MKKIDDIPHCGLCQVPLKSGDFKTHLQSPEHMAKLKAVADGDGSFAEQAVAGSILAKEAVDRLDKAFDDLEKLTNGLDEERPLTPLERQ